MKTNTLVKCVVACVISIVCIGYFLYSHNRQGDYHNVQPPEKGALVRQDSAGIAPTNKVSTGVTAPSSTGVLSENLHRKNGIVSASDQTAKEEMEKQMQLASAVFGVDFKSGFLCDREIRHSVFGWKIRDIDLSDGRNATFAVTTGQLLRYLSFAHEDVPRRLTKRDAISQDKAVEIARETLDKLGVGNGYEFDKIFYERAAWAGLDDSNSLTGGQWCLRGTQKFQGIPYFPSGICMNVSAYTGMVLAYVNDPMGPLPERLEASITADEASSIASDFLGIGFFGVLTGVDIRPPKKVISCRNSYFTSPGQWPLVQGDESFLCWDVVVDNLNDLPLRVFVNASTGEVIGGI